MKKYAVKDVQFTETTGPNGRPFFGVRFKLKDETYNVGVETVNADVHRDDVLRQVKRAVFFQLKALLELATYFGPVEKVLFAYVEVAPNTTLYDVAKPNLPAIKAGELGRLALAAPGAKA